MLIVIQVAHMAQPPRDNDDEQLSGSDMELGKVFSLLAPPRRRRVVDLLDGDDGDSLGDLAELVASQEYDVGFYPEDRKRIYISLVQSHVPKLDEAGVVRFDEEEKYVYPGPEFGALSRALDAVRGVEDCPKSDGGEGDEEGARGFVKSVPARGD